jgi:glycosyltransferase involved in cell wall biosynthesis
MSVTRLPRILVISPVRNEANNIERVARAMAAQELPPARWIVIDDHSTDGTFETLRAIEHEIPFLSVVEAPPQAGHASRDRLAAGAAVRNFNAGLAHANWREYTHVMKLDGDIELPPEYFRTLIARFETQPDLGLAGGVLDEPLADGRMRRIVIPRHHVHGALKLYTRECFEAIGGLQERLGWDTIDATYARMRGYRTHSYEDLVGTHHRPLGTADGVLRGRARHGAAAYIVHYSPWWVALRAFKIGLRYPPRGVSGFAFFVGYLQAARRRVERVPDPSYRAFTRRELRQRVVRLAAIRLSTSAR